MNINHMILAGSLLFAGSLQTVAASLKFPAVRDSIGIENLSGQKVILHKIGPKETYFSLSRRYQVTTKDMMALNKQRRLKIGDVVKVPTGLPFQMPATTKDTRANETTPNTATSEFIEYKVGPKETLYAIAKRFETTVEEIKKTNKLTENGLKNGQVLNIPQGRKTPPPPPPVVAAEVVDTSAAPASGDLDFPTDRFGLRQMTEKGVGVWIDDLSVEGGTMLALHKTAPIGTVVKITNPMTNRTTFAKVVGKYNETQETRDAIIVISKAAASLIGVIDRRFQISITYGIPNE